MQRTLIVIAACVFAWGTAASAATQTSAAYTGAHATFDQIDGNSAGRISFEEYRNFGVGVFHGLDANHDGIVDAKEHASATTDVDIVAFNAALRSWFDSADTNKDGYLDWDEWSAAPVGPARSAAGETK
ncbi:EF-hand domain-containing protein [Noviluteimonas gilva]|uniref:EF-hand domain-containing protein n=1 Tax=Noviluteimonas gilva TaxID=2682097 RepID=A0A7C9LJL2_9GAMM|nr:EF-hand domain-containing protein [Lysobacter gilvus]MUV15760.1 hypothetical protein [Lysobacter gilvus]